MVKYAKFKDKKNQHYDRIIVMKPRIFDYVFFLLFTFCIAFVIYVVSKSGGKNSNAVISTPEGQWIYSLEADGEYSFKGNLGETKILIQNKTVQVLDSPCDNKLCINAGKLKKNGEWAACLPNGVFLRIEGKDPDEELDVIAQ